MAGRGGLDNVLRYAVQGVAGGIGLASESVHAHKEKKKAKSNAIASSSTPTTPPQEDIPGDEVVIRQEDEKQWDLDDAQQEITGGESSDEEPSSYNAVETLASTKSKPDGTSITEAFIERYPPPTPTNHARPLPLPVILPQRRPKDRTRGFIRAYAPELEIKGIDQTMFLDFLQTFRKASEASPWINAINLAAIATSFIPDGFGISLAVGIVTQMSVKVAMDLQSKSRTNSFIDKINDEFYRPRGLYCLIMTWSPESSETSQAFDLTSIISAKFNSSSSGPSKFAKKFSSSGGKTYADMEFPKVAPLVYPVLDNLAEQQGEEAIGKHPDSVLAQTPKPTFTSRYADPNHPASSGSLISLVTGGHINLPTVQRGGGLNGGIGGLLGGLGGLGGGLGALLNRGDRGAFYDKSGRGIGDRTRSGESTQLQQDAKTEGQEYTQGQTRAEMNHGRGMSSQGDFGGGRGGGLGLRNGPLGLPLPTPHQAIKKLLKKDVLYLMIVNMPSEAEMAAAMAATAGQRH